MIEDLDRVVLADGGREFLLCPALRGSPTQPCVSAAPRRRPHRLPQGAKPGPNGKRIVDAKGPAAMVNRGMVNRSASGFISARLMLKKQFTRRTTRTGAALKKIR